MPAAPLDHAGLRSGMTLSFPADSRSGTRVRLSSGTEPAAATPHAATYADGAVVPRGPWRPPSCHEHGILYGTPKPGVLSGDWIAIVAVPDSVLDGFAPLRADAAAGNERALDASINGPAGRLAFVEAIRWATTRTDPTRPGVESPMVYGILPTGAATMTTGSHGRRVGLHVDSWYNAPLKDRAAAPNRLSINLGDHDRYLLCVNTPLPVMAEALREHGITAGATHPSYGLGMRFLAEFPHYPVTRITVHPGEAYLAPTENMLHDGYAEPHGQIDLQFSCRGRFPPPGNAGPTSGREGNDGFVPLRD
ncbi:hypothetical protein VMT65_12895 [Nocardia sp. CDC153]|uniref:hypothetical protein n=1 Tax=Nocardia sp. CDC153 TaxID=3112167 RepID=UPI002DBFF034|nr:hypothetical protein [Nocardia sp. CDC153]MEC3953926.1 hypothetical protein [Nocardia sp. CDC153]